MSGARDPPDTSSVNQLVNDNQFKDKLNNAERIGVQVTPKKHEQHSITKDIIESTVQRHMDYKQALQKEAVIQQSAQTANRASGTPITLPQQANIPNNNNTNNASLNLPSKANNVNKSQNNQVDNQHTTDSKKSSRLDNKLVKSLNTIFRDAEIFQDILPTFFDGSKFLSMNVDFQIWKAYKKVKDVIDLPDFCYILYKKVLTEIIPEDLTDLLKGGHYNSGKGGYNKEFCTYRFVIRTRGKDPERVQSLCAILLQGVTLHFDDMKVEVPAVMAPSNALYRTKIVRLSQFDVDFVTQGFGEWFYINVLKKMQGFQNSTLSGQFIMWNKDIRSKQFAIPDLSTLYLMLENVDDENSLSTGYKYADLHDGSLLNITLNSFAANRNLVADFYQYLQWPEFFAEDELNMTQSTTGSTDNDQGKPNDDDGNDQDDANNPDTQKRKRHEGDDKKFDQDASMDKHDDEQNQQQQEQRNDGNHDHQFMEHKGHFLSLEQDHQTAQVPQAPSNDLTFQDVGLQYTYSPSGKPVGWKSSWADVVSESSVTSTDKLDQEETSISNLSHKTIINKQSTRRNKKKDDKKIQNSASSFYGNNIYNMLANIAKTNPNAVQFVE